MGGAQGEDLARDLGLAVTSGNSLTAALALAQLDELRRRLEWRLGERTVAVVGASGDIGRACSLALAPRVRRLLLVARNRARLEALRKELPPGVEAHVSTDVADARRASVLVAATSAPAAILAETDLEPGTVVCDVGFPKSLSYSPSPRVDVLAFSAGLAEMPFDLDLVYYTRLPTARLMYGCFSEAIVLALSGRHESYSSGQGRLTLERLDHILSLAREHGFRPAPCYRGRRAIGAPEIATFLDHGGSSVR